MATRSWQVTADVPFPYELSVPLDPEGGPQVGAKATQISRIPNQRRTIGDAEVLICQGDESRVPGVEQDLRWTVAALIMRITTEEGDNVLNAATPYLDRVLESLSFQMQVPLVVSSVHVLDLTGPPKVGDTRDFTQWSGFATPTFRPSSMPMQSLIGTLVPDLGVDLDPSDRKANRALDWYLKALTARFEADTFMFTWIAVEILASDSALKVSEPYRGPACGHLIARCPECEAETSKPVQGASMKRYLTEGFGVDAKVANQLWQARQMLHGAHAFESTIMEDLAELSQQPRYVVVAELKQRLGISVDQPPFAERTGLAVSPFVGLGGTHTITAKDLDPLS